MDSGLAWLLAAAAAAGWVDAVVGGGGLIQLPALLMVPGLAPVQALGTNKLASVAGTATSAVTLYRRVRPDRRTAVPLAVAAGSGAVAGAWGAHLVPAALLRPVILVAMLAVLGYTLLRPELGRMQRLRFGGRQHHVAAGLVGAAIGLYDGMLGPGTGSFLVFALVGLLGYAFLPASALAKVANVATNAGALLVFVPAGGVVWRLALPMAAANVLGGYLGARSAVAGGSRFVRTVFLLVVTGLLVKLAHDVLG